MNYSRIFDGKTNPEEIDSINNYNLINETDVDYRIVEFLRLYFSLIFSAGYGYINNNISDVLLSSCNSELFEFLGFEVGDKNNFCSSKLCDALLYMEDIETIKTYEPYNESVVFIFKGLNVSSYLQGFNKNVINHMLSLIDTNYNCPLIDELKKDYSLVL